MDLTEVYYDLDGKKVNLLQLVSKEPEWAANTIQRQKVVISGLRNDVRSLEDRIEILQAALFRSFEELKRGDHANSLCSQY